MCNRRLWGEGGVPWINAGVLHDREAIEKEISGKWREVEHRTEKEVDGPRLHYSQYLARIEAVSLADVL